MSVYEPYTEYRKSHIQKSSDSSRDNQCRMQELELIDKPAVASRREAQKPSIQKTRALCQQHILSKMKSFDSVLLQLWVSTVYVILFFIYF